LTTVLRPGGRQPRLARGRGGTGLITGGDGRAAPPAPPGGRTGRRPGLLARNPAWPITALLVGYPLWWALGIADFVWFLLAIPMAARMLAWRRLGNRKLRLPPGFGWWLLFLVWAVAGVVVLSLTAPDTIASPVSHRVLSYANRTATYLGLTVMLLYAGNLTERELPKRRLAWLLGILAIYTTVLGLAALAKPHFQFSSPAMALLPHSARTNAFIQASMHPGLSQVQNVFGSSTQARPKAPFDYTNTWGECLSITIPWLLVACRDGTRRQRLIGWGTAALALVPLIYSLNRGVWIGVGAAAVYMAVRLAAKGKMAMLGGLAVGVVVIAVLVVASPLQSVISQRLHHGRSNNIRSNLSGQSITVGLSSPIIGYGDTRQQQGSPSSIAVGPTARCPSCGQAAVGSTGQLWLLLVCNGFVGTGLYLGFFACGIWRFRRDRTLYGLVGVMVIGLSFIYMFTYDALPAPLGLTMLAYAIVWRDDVERRAAATRGGLLRRPARPALPGPAAELPA